MASTEPQQGGQPHLQKQDLATLVRANFFDKFILDYGVMAWLRFIPNFKRISQNWE